MEAEEEDEAPPDDHEEEAVLERPRKRKKARKAKHQGGGGQWLLIGGLAAGLLLVLGGGGVGAYFLWSYGTNRGTGDEDPLAYLPPHANLVIGIDYAALLNDPVLGPQVKTSFQQQGGRAGFFDEVKKQSGLEVKELFAHAVIGMEMNFSQGGNPFRGAAMPGGMAASGIQVPTTLILKPSRPFHQRKIAQASKNAVHKSYGGLAYYEINDGGFKTLFMPSNHTIVLSSLDIQQMGPLFAAGGVLPNLSPGMASMVRGIEKNTLWMAVPFEGELKQELDAGLARNPPPADLKDLVDALSKSGGTAVWGNLEGNRVKLGLGISCADAATAAHTTDLVKD